MNEVLEFLGSGGDKRTTTSPVYPTKDRTANILIGRIDQFLANPPKQPKREIADYVQQNGILVPKRFQNLELAREYVKSGGEIIVRSEHPHEYAGASGLLASYIINQGEIARGKKFCDKNGKFIDWEYYASWNELTKQDIKIQTLGQIDTLSQSEFEENLRKLSEQDVRSYCELLSSNFDDFNNQISYSYWEKISGFNRSIVADSAIPNRYHIFTKKNDQDLPFHNYFIIDNGNIVLDSLAKLTKEMETTVPKIIEFYEKIRGLEKFNPEHCPIVEFQTDDNQENYFLQYHRTIDMSPATFALDRELEEHEFQATFVRGATPPEGLTLRIAMFYPDNYPSMEQEAGSFDFHWNHLFSEIMSRRRIINFRIYTMGDLARRSCDDHLSKSVLFNPQLSVSIPSEKIPRWLVDRMYTETNETGVPARISMRIVSDGRKAYVRFEKE